MDELKKQEQITPMQFLKQSRKEFNEKKIDANEFGRRLRYVRYYLSWENMEMLG